MTENDYFLLKESLKSDLIITAQKNNSNKLNCLYAVVLMYILSIFVTTEEWYWRCLYITIIIVIVGAIMIPIGYISEWKKKEKIKTLKKLYDERFTKESIIEKLNLI